MNTISSLDDLRIGVINNGPFEPTWHYAGKPYTYKARNPQNKTAITVVPWVVAQHHWGLGIKQGSDGKTHVVRKDWKEPNDRDSLLESRLACIVPKRLEKSEATGTSQFIDDPEMKKWFLSGVQFKVRVMRQEWTEEEFNAGA